MADLQAKYMTSKNTWHTIHHLSLKMFENVRNISKSTANHSALQFESCNKEHHKILKEAQIIKLQSTTWNWIHPNFCSWLSETNDHSINYFFPKIWWMFKVRIEGERSWFIVHKFQPKKKVIKYTQSRCKILNSVSENLLVFSHAFVHLFFV